MTEEQTRRAAQDVIYLVRCAINEEKPDLSRIGNTEEVYAFAAWHKLTAAAAMALESAGQKDRRSKQTIAKALKRRVILEQAFTQVKAELEKKSIWYMPLKGSVLKDVYPKAGMREMGDCDILFDAERAEDVKVIMEGLGFETKHFGTGAHDVYYKAPALRFEMHRTLFDPSFHEEQHEYYKDVQGRLFGSGCEKHFSPEDFYLYITAHEYKHYIGSGTGLRSLLDTYVYLRKETLDMTYVRAEAEKLGIAEFEAANRSLSLHLFSGGELTAEERKMLDYILSSGTYGTVTHRVENTMRRDGWNKIRYALDRFFVPVSRKNKRYAMASQQYPFFYRHKSLLPILLFYRTFRAIKTGRFAAEVKAIRQAKKHADNSPLTLNGLREKK